MKLKRTKHVADTYHIKKLLLERGYSVARLTDAIRLFQKFHGLPVTGIVGQRTWRELSAQDSGIRLCGMPDLIVVNGVAKWPMNRATWNITKPVPGLSLADQKDSYKAALDSISKVCDFTFEYKANTKAHLDFQAKPLGGPGGVLGQTWLPINAVEGSQIVIEMDSGERWGKFVERAGGAVPIQTVACHEAGHWLGLPHGGKDIMQPTLSEWDFMGPWSIAELVKRYGKPKADAVPTPPDIAPDSMKRIAIPGPGKYLLDVKA